MPRCFFVTDLHGHRDRYETLYGALRRDRPAALFLGGDLLPHGLYRQHGPEGAGDFLEEVLVGGFAELRQDLGEEYPEIFVILGNDDGRWAEQRISEAEGDGLWHYAHGRRVPFGPWDVYGYAYVPPTPFRLKDWERYDVSWHTDPGSLPLEQGVHTVPVDLSTLRFHSIRRDLDRLTAGQDLSRGIFLFHAPPYETPLDRAALDGVRFENVPLDTHIGSIAIRRFLEERGPLVSLHGHVHESTRLTGEWRDRIGGTWAFNAAHDGPELALVRFDPEAPEQAERELI